jgi:hypothetical protein
MLDAQAAQPLGKTILNNLEELNGQIVKIHIYVACAWQYPRFESTDSTSYGK